MKLKSALKRCKTEIVRVGTKGGSGFVYIGSREELKQSGISLLDREVVDIYAGQTENHTVYIIEGNEDGHVEYNGDPNWGREIREKECAEAMVAAAYKEAVKELTSAYRQILKAETLDEIMIYAAEAVDAERFLLDDTYGVFGEAGARPAIKTLRKEVIERIRAEEEL